MRQRTLIFFFFLASKSQRGESRRDRVSASRLELLAENLSLERFEFSRIRDWNSRECGNVWFRSCQPLLSDSKGNAVRKRVETLLARSACWFARRSWKGRSCVTKRCTFEEYFWRIMEERYVESSHGMTDRRVKVWMGRRVSEITAPFLSCYEW